MILLSIGFSSHNFGLCLRCALLAYYVAGIAPSLRAQNSKSLNVVVAPDSDTHPISPYIYGSNGQSEDRDENIAARRLGGNRLTGYNWENNASNAGTDYINHSDDYLTSIAGITGADVKKPGIVITAFHDTSLSMGCYSLVTLQAAGYVASDVNGTVADSETAPSKRWKQVQFMKGSPFQLAPDTTDDLVSMDEEVNFLVNKYPTNKIQGYEIDNEPALWPSTHPRIHPNQPKVSEYIAKSVALSKAVKAVDPSAEMFGGVMYGYAEYLNFQSAPDWNSYSSYGTYINAYLANMNDSSAQAGKRLLDVLDLHWYPEAQGTDAKGNLVRIAQSSVADSGVAAAREQAPRSLWDSSYTEKSWIGQYYSPVALLPMLNASIEKYYPGTKLAFTEINYGGDTSISGAIAMADVFGLFGSYGVYLSSYWGPLQSYVAETYKMYRNYNGSKSTFGDVSCHATINDTAAISAYASLDSHDSTKLHVIVIDKQFTEHPTLSVTINSKKQFSTADVYSLTSSAPVIVHDNAPHPVKNNTLTLTATPQSVTHIIFTSQPNESVQEAHNAAEELSCANLEKGTLIIHYNVSDLSSIRIIDLQGRIINSYVGLMKNGTIEWSGASGVYEIVLNDKGKIIVKKIIILQ